METITVVEEKIKKDKNGREFANVRLEDGRYTNFMYANYDAYEGLGDYYVELSRDGVFWRADKLKKKGNGLPKIEESSKTVIKASDLPGATKTLPRPSQRDSSTNRSILLQVCIKAAAEVFHGSCGETEPANKFIKDQVTSLASAFLAWAEKNSQDTIEEVSF